MERGSGRTVDNDDRNGPRDAASRGRLRARPRMGIAFGAERAGLHRLSTVGADEAILLVPRGYRPDQPAPFVLSFHGAGGDAVAGLYPFREVADDAGLLVLAPASRGATWDLLRGGFGPDVDAIDRLLGLAFARVNADPARLAVAGFSDGASYALSLGLANGDLFRRIAAFSPGFAAPPSTNGEPRVFISHGDDDRVLPIERCSRRIVPRLRNAGYAVTYREFAGGHNVPDAIVASAIAWLTSTGDLPLA